MRTRELFTSSLAYLTIAAVSLSSSVAAAGLPTAKHEAGRCAIRGVCKQGGFFTPTLPCADNDKAEDPGSDLRKKLVGVCGDAWSSGPICCTDAQLDALSDNLQKAGALISACPACQTNFNNLFCTFTCSPDQSLFINVTDTEAGDKDAVAVSELDTLWSDKYGETFYDSCKDVKYGATGSPAMNFIGGGAKNYTDFLKFLGHKAPFLGSPFQINFPRPEGREKDGMKAADPLAHPCNDPDEAYRCSCVDCPKSCPELKPLDEGGDCHVGLLPCLSFASIFTYCILVLLGITAIVGHVVAFRYKRERNERLRLLQDASPSDDEDEGDLVHSAGFLDRPTKHYKVNQILDKAFARLGRFCARYPLTVIGLSVSLVVFLSLGWMNFGIETDPVRLWVSPGSEAANDKQFFDESFGSFYRVEQAFLINETNGVNGPVLDEETLKWWLEVESGIARLTPDDSDTTLKDVCFNPTGAGCIVQSVSGWFEDGIKSNWRERLSDCAENPGNTDCFPPSGQPLKKELVLGGYDKDVLEASAMITTWVVSSQPQGSAEEARVIEWEDAVRDRLNFAALKAKERGLRLSYTTEASLEQELSQSTNTDAKIVVISYLVMFAYASLSLGSTSLTLRSLTSHPVNALVRSKFSLGVAGIIVVLMSVSASVGLFSAFEIKSTLIIAEVIPFLVLAVGVDNIFLIVHEFERVNRDYSDEMVETRMAKALGRMGPSILLAGLSETIAFALGTVVGMPAVRNFAIYATGAIFINALLQVTLFVAVLSLNQQRVESNRVDCVPCIKIRQSSSSIYGAAHYGVEGESWLQSFIRKRYAPFLLDRRVKAGVVALFLGVFAVAVALLPEIPFGLDQKLAVPSSSYLVDYFSDLAQYFETGPPVYFVTRNINATAREHQRQICGRFTTCETFSLPTVLEQESKRSDQSYITGASANWLDDFFFFLRPDGSACCADKGKECFEDRDPQWNITLHGMPEGDEFIHYLHNWLSVTPDADCPLGGKALYNHAIVIDDENSNIPASYFLTYHTPVQTQDDFINAYASAKRICNDIKEQHGIDVFPYSKFYVFFEQYASIVRLTGTLIGSALGLILIITSILLGSLATGLAITLTVGMIVVDVIGAMALSGVSLNAVTLVNLVICVGIGVEFCAHVARAFAFPSRSLMSSSKNKYRGRDARVWTGMVDVAGSVFSGITITKLLGVIVLAFTRSKIFEIFYFRIWIALVAFASTHALIWLPVVLSLVGGEGYIDPESDGGIEDDLAARRYRALLPNEDYDSDEY